jgi:hypothetical protein
VSASLDRARRRVERVRVASPDVYRLVRLASPAVRVEPHLLRRLRLDYLSDADVGVEADVWFSTLVGTRGTDRIVLHADAAAVLRGDLASDQALLRRVRRTIAQAHHSLPATLRLEEELIWLGLTTDAEDETEAALRPAVRTLIKGGDHARALAQWVLRALPRAHERVRSHPAAMALMLRASTVLGNRRILAGPPAQGVDLSSIAWALPPEALADPEWIGVELLRDGIRFTQVGPSERAIQVARTAPRLAELSWSVGGHRSARLVEVAPGLEHPVDADVAEVVLRTLDGSEFAVARLDAPAADAPPAAPPEPYCYVVMGFGKKTDWETGRTLDLDASYHSMIRPAVEAAGLKCLRADELIHSGPIDAPMYEQLLNADLVVADLSTFNRNALYELGIRHALRPHTTVVIAEDGIRRFPFDLSLLPVHQYRHFGDGIGEDEVRRLTALLTGKIRERLVSESIPVDSPIYRLLPDLVPPRTGQGPKAVADEVQSAAAMEMQAARGDRSARSRGRGGTCFVTMGFGKKTDFETGRILDLDASYHSMIKPAVEAAGLKCLRADELIHSGRIDVPMYEQLLDADIVVADLSTSDRNALYELGIRHALRPHTTVVITEAGMKSFPFDLHHVVVRQYKHLGDDIGASEVRRFSRVLTDVLVALRAEDPPGIDSPVYHQVRDLSPPHMHAASDATPPPAL